MNTCTAMILAAGRGERMRPLTDDCPKPLLQAGNARLIEHQIRRCSAAGHRHILINTHYRAGQIHAALGDGSAYGVALRYSDEFPEVLETGGGIANALPQLDPQQFLVVNGDVWCDHPLTTPSLPSSTLAHLIMVDNPAHNPQGDFALAGDLLRHDGQPRLTFSGIGWYRPALFAGQRPARFALAPLLRQAMQRNQVSGEYFNGDWRDIGTPGRLQQLDEELRAKP